MFAYFAPQRTRWFAAALLGFGLMFASACSPKGPQVNVIGVGEAGAATTDSLLVFIEVTNPTQVDLELSRLEYNLEANSWFSSSGAVPLSRPINAGSTAVVEIPVRITDDLGARPQVGASYTLEGTLYAREDRIERSWSVKARGALDGAGRASRTVRLRIADTGQ